MRPFVLRDKANLGVSSVVERFFEVERPLSLRILAALFFAFVGLCAILVINNLTGTYFASITIMTAILVTLFSGLFSGVFIALGVAFIADYLFIPPTGSVLANRIEHFLIIALLATSMSALAATLREVIRKAISAKREAERASVSMEKILSTISHDIRNSLGVSALAIDLMQRSCDKPERLRSRPSWSMMTLTTICF